MQSRPHYRRRILAQAIGLLLLPSAALAQSAAPESSVPTIIEQIGKLEQKRDPKCYATASRLEDFIYGTPLESETRFEKIELQKALIRTLWQQASDAARTAGAAQVDAAALSPFVQAAVPFQHHENGDYTLHGDDPVRRTEIAERDRRQYGTVAYALRAVLAVQQDALLDPTSTLLPLSADAVDLFKEAIDLITLAALQHADRATRLDNSGHMGPALLRKAWQALVLTPTAPAPSVAAAPAVADTGSAERFPTIRAIVDEKLAAYAAYNNLSMPLFVRNIQVYMARHGWPTDEAESKGFKDVFNEAMIQFTADVMLEAERQARQAGHPYIRVTDVHTALQMYEPHTLNAYEDVIYFPRLPRNKRITIEAYDLDSFRDPGIHWFYLAETLKDPNYAGTLEPDPFAAELLVEGTAQFGGLMLRIAGNVAKEEESLRLNRSHLAKALVQIQTLLNENASAPADAPQESGVVSVAASASAPQGGWFSDATAASGVVFRHRMSDWLNRLIRSYTVRDGEVAQLAVPQAFGGGGLAIADLDNDGDDDLLLLSGSGNRLFLADGEGKFIDATQTAGIAWTRPDGLPGEPRQPLVADFDNDGLQDIFISYVDDDHRLYRNLGGGRFEDVTAKAGLGGKGMVGGPAVAIDYDKDGLLDLYIGYFGDYVRGVLPTLARRNSNGLPDKLFHNQGGLVFQDATAGSGVDNLGWAQAFGHADFDGDGWEDLICGNDFGVNAWYRNLGNGKFEDISTRIGTDKPSYTMNVGITDLNRDGYPDVYISNIVTMNKDEKYILPDDKMRMKFNPDKLATMRVVEANDLFTSVAADGKLAEYRLSDAVGRGLNATGWAWGSQFFDYDNDGDDDLYVTNGMNEFSVYSSVNPYFTDSSGQARDVIIPVSEKERNVFFVNDGGKLNEESRRSGTDILSNSRAVGYVDIDDDGDLDIVINNFNMPAVVLRNHSEARGHHWIKVTLEGDPSKGVTRDAIGAQLIADSEHSKGMWREVFSAVGYLTSPSKVQHFGLGVDTSADLTVRWPNGERQSFKGVKADTRYRLRQGGELVPVVATALAAAGQGE